MIELNESNYSDFVKASNLPILIDFWAPWCSPCRAITPILERLSKEFEGKLLVAKVNVDDNQDLAQKFSVMSIPTLIIVNGEKTVSTVGALSYERLVEFVKGGLSG